MKLKLLYLIFLVGSIKIFGQTYKEDLSTTDLSYYSVRNIDTTSVKVAVDQIINDIAKDDIVLVIQIKGAIQTDNVLQQIDVNNAGNYEFFLVDSVYDDTLILAEKPQRVYTVAEPVQLVKVPTYNFLTINSDFNVPAWDGVVGGVLPIIAHQKLTLNAKLSADYAGFRGGQVDSEGLTAITCTAPEASHFPESEKTKAARKGESILTVFDDQKVRGFGYIANAGGGGHGNRGGGGGGSNGKQISGGTSGTQHGDCSGLPNYKFIYSQGGYLFKDEPASAEDFYNVSNINSNKVYFGGGGGSAPYLQGETAFSGGNGGGIIIILTDTLEVNDGIISAVGGTVEGKSSGGGAGGGGGGAILLDVSNFIINNSLTIDFAGGKGGDVNACTGSGGGGSGGVFLHSGNAIPGEIVLNDAGGLPGNSDIIPGCQAEKGSVGSDGTIINNLLLPLTGFYFNNIPFELVHCQYDTVRIDGSTPRTYNRPYDLEWQYTDDLESGIWNTDPTADNQENYVKVMTESLYFRRIFRIGSVEDTSNICFVKVWPEIEKNLIDNEDQYICKFNIPEPVIAQQPEGGNNSYSYLWQSSTNQTDWDTATFSSSNNQLSPSSLTSTIYIRRIIESAGVCFDTTGVYPLYVHPAVENEIVYPGDTICYDQAPNPLTEVPASTGWDDSFSYIWEQNIDNSGWTNATGNYTESSYTPGALTDTTSYRRIAADTVPLHPERVCYDTSNTVLVLVYPLIANNIIENESVTYLCSEEKLVLRSDPEKQIYGGAGSYEYFWQLSLDGEDFLDTTSISPLNDTVITPSLTDSIYYRRIVYSGPERQCADTTSILIRIWPLPEAHLVDTDTIFCERDSVYLPVQLSGASPWTLSISDSRDIELFQQNDSVLFVFNGMDSVQTETIHILNVQDANQCIAKNYSGQYNLKIYERPKPEMIMVDSSEYPCGDTLRVKLTKRRYNGYWTVSPVGTFEDEYADTTLLSIPFSGTEQTVVYNWTGINTIPVCNTQLFDTVTFYEPFDSLPNLGDKQKPLYGNYELTVMNSNYPYQNNHPAVWTTQPEVERIENISNESANFVFTVNDDADYRIFYTIINGTCKATDSIDVIIESFFEPTGFSPNNDGINETFMIEGVKGDNLDVFVVFNQWGHIVYKLEPGQLELALDIETNELKKSFNRDMQGREYLWDGTDTYEIGSGEPFEDGTFYYLLRLKKGDDKKGYIILKR